MNSPKSPENKYLDEIIDRYGELKAKDNILNTITYKYTTTESIVNDLGLRKKIYKPYLLLIIGILLSFAALFQGGHLIESVKKIKDSNTERTWWGFGHNAIIEKTISTSSEVLQLKQIFGGSNFDKVGSIDKEKEQEIIEDIKLQLEKIAGTHLKHHLGGLMRVLGKILNINPTLSFDYKKPSITLDKVVGTASNEDSEGTNPRPSTQVEGFFT